MINLVKCCVVLLLFSVQSFALVGTYEQAQALRKKIELRPSFNSEYASEFGAFGFDQGPKGTVLLPVSRGFWQLDTELCWTYSTFNALETLYLIRNPDKKFELSRGVMQVMTMEDRFLRWINNGEKYLSERGDEIDALSIIKNWGVTNFDDYDDIKGTTNDIYSEISRDVSIKASNEEKIKALHKGISKYFKPIPTETHFEGTKTNLVAVANALLQNEEWLTYAVSKNGFEGMAKHPDPDARLGTMAYFMSADKIAQKIKASLLANHPVMYGTMAHSVLIYGAEFDTAGNAVSYNIKDSYPNYFYKADAQSVRANMMDITTIK